MGSIVDVHCVNCGLTQEHSVGAGMLDFRTYCSFPFACHDCKSVVTINRFEETHKCPTCESTNLQPYDHPDLQENKPQDYVVNWGEYLLSEGAHYCPACKHQGLWFKQGALFD